MICLWSAGVVDVVLLNTHQFPEDIRNIFSRNKVGNVSRGMTGHRYNINSNGSECKPALPHTKRT